MTKKVLPLIFVLLFISLANLAFAEEFNETTGLIISTTDVLTASYGFKFKVNTTSSLIEVVKIGFSASTRVRLFTAAYGLIATAGFSGDTATFSEPLPDLIAGTSYIIEADDSGAAHTRVQSTPISYPVAGVTLNYTSGSIDGGTTVGVGYDILALLVNTTPLAPSANENLVNVTITEPSDESPINIGADNISDWNHRFWINATHNDTTQSTCVINDTRWDRNESLSGSNFVAFENNSLIADGIFTLEVFCNRTDTNINGSDIITITLDTVKPTITLNQNNAFNTTNMSNIIQYNNLFTLNITFADDSSLSVYEINITRGNKIFFNVTNTSMTTNSFTHYQELNISTWPEGVFDIELIVADDHTISQIQDYEISRFGNRLTFDTAEGTQISISSIGAYNTDYVRRRDRYSFSFDYLLQDSARTFYVESDYKLRYLPNSRYDAHFISWNPNTKTGNWIDFEGIGGNYQVNKITDYKYEVIFTDVEMGNKLILNSIGGLNVVTENYQWYRGNFSLGFNEIATSGTFQEYTLNISTESGFVEDINASFEYNGTQHDVIKTVNLGHIFFESNLTVPSVEDSLSMEWFVNVSQNSTPPYNFSIIRDQSLFLSILNVSIFDEENQSVITEEVTLIFTLDETTRFTTSSGSILIGNLSIGEYFVTGESASYPRRGLFVTVANQSNQLNFYLVVDAIGNDFIDLFTKDTSQNNVEDARWTVQRRFNTSFETVAQFESDFAGQGQLFLDQGNEYNMIITHPDFATATFGLRPILTRYTFFLQAAFESQYDNVYEGIIYTLSPKDRILNVSDVAYEIRLDIFSDDSSLQYFGIDIDNHSFTCVPVSCFINVTGTPAGGSASIFILLNETGTFDVHYFFKRAGFDLQYISGIDYSAVILDVIFGVGFADLLENLRGDLKTQVMMSLFAAIFTTVLCAIAASIGINGMPLVLIATLGNIFFTMSGFIPVFIGITITIMGLLIWGVLSRDDA